MLTLRISALVERWMKRRKSLCHNSVNVLIAVSVPWLCTWLDVYLNRKKPFSVLLQNIPVEKYVSIFEMLKKKKKSVSLALTKQPSPLGSLTGTGWGHTGCAALPDRALPWRNFDCTSFLSSSSPKFLPPNVPCTLVLADFPVSHK